MTGPPLPLAGRRVLVTRTREQAEGLVDRIHDAGGSVAVVPLIATVPVAEPDAIAEIAATTLAAPQPRWVAFTSATAARLVIGAAGAPALSGMLVAAVGPATASALEASGVTPDLVGGERDAGGLADAMLERGMRGATVWIPSAEGARVDLAARLRGAGAAVTVHHIYRSVMPAAAPELLRAAFAAGVDAITLTSGSTARNLSQAMAADGVPASAVIVCIGEQTAAEARAVGLAVRAVAREASVEGLVSALTECLSPQRLR
jgi:uroporphyrinogen-III synthase